MVIPSCIEKTFKILMRSLSLFLCVFIELKESCQSQLLPEFCCHLN